MLLLLICARSRIVPKTLQRSRNCWLEQALCRTNDCSKLTPTTVQNCASGLNVSRVCASWRERACPDRTSAQSSPEPHSSARSCWSPAKKSFCQIETGTGRKTILSLQFLPGTSPRPGREGCLAWVPGIVCLFRKVFYLLTQITIFCTHLLKKTVNNGMIFPQYKCI